MQPERPPLHEDALELLEMLGHAANAGGIGDSFEYWPLDRYKLGWMSHPGLRDSLAIVHSAALNALEQAGMIVSEPKHGETHTFLIVLTPAGWECYARCTGGSIPPSPPSNNGSALQD